MGYATDTISHGVHEAMVCLMGCPMGPMAYPMGPLAYPMVLIAYPMGKPMDPMA